MAARDDSAVEREAFLAALKTLDPLPPDDDMPGGETGGDEAQGRTDPPANESQAPGSHEEKSDRESVMAEIAEGVQAEAERDDSDSTATAGGTVAPFARGPAEAKNPPEARGGSEAAGRGPVPDRALDGDREARPGHPERLDAGDPGRGTFGGATFEELVREVLADELRHWVEDNLEAVTERVVRDELRMMGRRRPER